MEAQNFTDVVYQTKEVLNYDFCQKWVQIFFFQRYNSESGATIISISILKIVKFQQMII